MSKEFDKQLEYLHKMAEKSGVDIREFLERAKKKLLKEEAGDSGDKKEQTQNVNTTSHSSTVDEHEEAWKKVLLARHSDRPNALHYIDKMSDQYLELKGDRYFGDDAALVGGLCTINNVHFTFIGNQKGANMKESIKRNYGMAHPEGYRKALRLVKQAEYFKRPILSLIDTSGAYPGLASEERGIGEAIARNLMELSVVSVPIICVILGEGGSGGALGIGIGDRIYMLENSVYSVISPEGFASILLRDPKRMKEAASLMKMTAQDVLNFGFIDGIIPEPSGGAHIDVDETASNIRTAVLQAYSELNGKDMRQVIEQRSRKIINWTRPDQNVSDKNKNFFQKVKDLFVD